MIETEAGKIRSARRGASGSRRALASTALTLALCATGAVTNEAVASPARSATKLSVAIRQLPAGQRTIGQLAAYYYGSPRMSFVLQLANPWLQEFPAGQSLTTFSGLALHPMIRLPTTRDRRPIGP